MGESLDYPAEFSSDVSLLALTPGVQEPPAAFAGQAESSAASSVGRGCRAKGVVQVRGIGCIQMGDRVYYSASVMIGILGVSSRVVVELATVLDHLAVLTTFKQRALQGMRSGQDFEVALRNALADTMRELGVEAVEELSLRFYLTLSKSYWIGRRQKLHTPKIASLETVLGHWRRFARLQQEFSHPDGRVYRGLLNRHSPPELEDNWRRFVEAYLDASCGLAACAEATSAASGTAGGSAWHSREAVARRLEGLVAANAWHRDKQLGAWNTRRLHSEEVRQRRAERCERALRRRECRDLQREDLASQLGAGRSKTVEAEVQELSESWLALLARRRRLHDLRARRHSEAAARRARATRRTEERQMRQARDARWRWMKRRDLTMADIMGGGS